MRVKKIRYGNPRGRNEEWVLADEEIIRAVTRGVSDEELAELRARRDAIPPENK